MIERDLFDRVMLVRNWGRIGTNGRDLVEEFANEVEVGQALEVMPASKRRRGYRDLWAGEENLVEAARNRSCRPPD